MDHGNTIVKGESNDLCTFGTGAGAGDLSDYQEKGSYLSYESFY